MMTEKKTKRAGKQSRKPPTSQEIVIQIQRMAHGGRGFGKHRGRAIFIPYTIPGEKALARITRREKHADFAEGIQLLETSADRVSPQCPHFGPNQCWGCQWQHIDYQAQLLLKQEVLADQLARIGKFPDRIILNAWHPVIPSPQLWGYNYHMTLERAPDGALGFRRADRREIEPITECHITHPDLLALVESLQIDFADIKSLKLQLDSNGETMLVITLLSENAPEIAADFPTSVNAILPNNEPVNLIGNFCAQYAIGDRRFRVTAGGYFRPNIGQLENLVSEVLKASQLQGHETVLDLYAGVGIFSAFVAPRSELVIMAESYPPAVTDAEANLADFDHIDILEGAVEEILFAMKEDGATADIAIVDPPASGLDKRVIQLLQQLGIHRIVYVSSDPVSLARDGSQFIRQGYHLANLQPIDFAPHTSYIDTVALFERH